MRNLNNKHKNMKQKLEIIYQLMTFYNFYFI